MKRRWIPWLLLALALAACTRAATAQEPQIVLLHIFSGMFDPSWELSPRESRELEAMLNALPEGTPLPEVSILGYRGFSLHDAQTQTLRAFSGVVHLAGAEERWLVDPERSVERWLLASGKDALPDEIYAEVQEALDAPLEAPETTPVDGPDSEPAKWALYLTEEHFTPQQLESTPLSEIPLLAEPLLTTDDLQAYALPSHTLTLHPGAAARLESLPIKMSGRAFVLRVGDEPIYAGAFWTPLSSLSFDGVVIQVLPSAGASTFEIELGYPGPDFFPGPDPRSDPRIFRILERAGKLEVAIVEIYLHGAHFTFLSDAEHETFEESVWWEIVRTFRKAE